MGDPLRIQARQGVVEFVRRDGVRAAEQHGQNAPTEADAAGDRIVTNVRLPEGAVIVSGGGLPRGLLVVQSVHGRSQAWAPLSSRVAVMGEDGSAVVASAWSDGAWGGDSVVRAAPSNGHGDLPPTANPA